MRKTKWTGLAATLLAGTTIATVMTTSKHMAKKYGQRPNPSNLFDVNVSNLINYAIDRFVKTDDEEIIEVVDEVTEK